MFSLYCDGNCFYDDSIPSEEYRVISPNLEKEVGSAGTLSFVLPPTNIYYDNISRDSSEIVCYKNDEEIWRGRILTDKMDFYNQRNIECEGVLAYFNDVIVPYIIYGDPKTPEYTYPDWINYILTNYYNPRNGNGNNYYGNYDKRIYMGTFDNYNQEVTKLRSFSSENNTVLELINDAANTCKVYPVIRHEKRNGDAVAKNYVDFIGCHEQTGMPDGSFFGVVVNQEIIFAENLLDFTKNYDVSTLVTAVTMKGSQIEDSDNYYDLTPLGAFTEDGISHVNADTAMFNVDAVSSYGWRETVLDVETTGTEESTPDSAKPSYQLKTIGKNYLRVSQFDNMSIEISAVDLAYLGLNVDFIDIYKDIKVISDPHGLDRYFPITKIEIPIDQPENTTYTMGISDDISLSSSYNKTNQDILNKIAALPSEKSILDAAKEQAGSAIADATTGYITITHSDGKSEALIISRNPDYSTPSDQPLWVFNSSGLGFFPHGIDGGTVNVAMTNDGQIVADRITTGTLLASLIKGENIILKNLTQANGDHVILNKDAFEGRRFINNEYLTSFVIKPMDGVISYTDPNDNTTTLGNIVRYSSIVHKFECEDLWISGATTGNDGSIIPTVYSMQGMGSYIDRSGYMAADSYSYLYNGSTGRRMNASYISHSSYAGGSGDVPLWRIPIGGRYLSFYHGILVQDEPISNAWSSIGMSETDASYNDTSGNARDIYYTGDITIGSDTWKVINGMIVGQSSTNP